MRLTVSMWTDPNILYKEKVYVFAEHPVGRRIATDGLPRRAVEWNTRAAIIFPLKDFGNVALLSMHRTASMIVRPSRSLRPFCSGVLGKLNC